MKKLLTLIFALMAVMAGSNIDLRALSLAETKDFGIARLIVDDVLDTGFTMKTIIGNMLERGASSVRTCVLLNKNLSGKFFVSPDWVGFEIPNEYVVGYGLDSNEEYRNLPYIAVKE